MQTQTEGSPLSLYTFGLRNCHNERGVGTAVGNKGRESGGGFASREQRTEAGLRRRKRDFLKGRKTHHVCLSSRSYIEAVGQPFACSFYCPMRHAHFIRSLSNCCLCVCLSVCRLAHDPMQLGRDGKDACCVRIFLCVVNTSPVGP